MNSTERILLKHIATAMDISVSDAMGRIHLDVDEFDLLDYPPAKFDNTAYGLLKKRRCFA